MGNSNGVCIRALINRKMFFWCAYLISFAFFIHNQFTLLSVNHLNRFITDRKCLSSTTLCEQVSGTKTGYYTWFSFSPNRTHVWQTTGWNWIKLLQANKTKTKRLYVKWICNLLLKHSLFLADDSQAYWVTKTHSISCFVGIQHCCSNHNWWLYSKLPSCF